MINQLKEDLQKELTLFNEQIQASTNTDIDLANEVSNYVLSTKGKMIRPFLTFTIGRMLESNTQEIAKFCVGLEHLHNACLLHDDIIDQAETRRHKLSVYAKYGTSVAILTGDFLFARSLQVALGNDNHELVRILVDATVKLTEGELLQQQQKQSQQFDLKIYQKIIDLKTTSLFVAATKGALTTSKYNNTEIAHCLIGYASALGRLFQYVDDLMDVTTGMQTSGKSQQTDFSNGYITLPYLLALEKLDEKSKTELLKLRDVNHKQFLDECTNLAQQEENIEQVNVLISQQYNIGLEFLKKLGIDNYWSKYLENFLHVARFRVRTKS